MNVAAARHFELETQPARRARCARNSCCSTSRSSACRTARAGGLEVLLRWRHPEQGLVAPDDFIPILEENGLIVPVGEWVIRAACEQAMAWQRAGLPPVPLAVNLSARQFMHRGLIESIRASSTTPGIDPACWNSRSRRRR
jgi:EAL domain-containing protein (putative c-di-GMP-specific phosphodiesterase class I)